MGKIPMNQRQLFYEDVFDAVKAAVQHAGGAKEVGPKLWPTKPTLTAQKELLDCLNRSEPRKLCIEELLTILKLAREAGFHQAKNWIDEALGYQPTPPADPKIERDRLADELARAADHFKSLQKAVERLTDQKIRAA